MKTVLYWKSLEFLQTRRLYHIERVWSFSRQEDCIILKESGVSPDKKTVLYWKSLGFLQTRRLHYIERVWSFSRQEDCIILKESRVSPDKKTVLYWKSLESLLAPVPLSIFRLNSKFDENSECSSFIYTGSITTIFCTRHDSDTVVTCAKYRCDRPRILYTRVFWIFIEFRIRSKYA